MTCPDRWALLLLVLTYGGLTQPGRADAPPVFAAAPCDEAARLVEQEAGLPAGLLHAIGLVESGRFDAMSGQVMAWPWSVNAAGQDHVFSSAAEAMAFTRERQHADVRSIDVGCFQINLMHHPDAFATLEQAFDPVANAAYAARFLVALHQRAGSWAAAAGLYHSATPELGGPYRDQVLALWQGKDSNPEKARGPRAVPLPAPDPFVVRLLGSPLSGVRVWRPASIPPPAGPVDARVMPRRPDGRIAAPPLPRVVTVSR